MATGRSLQHLESLLQRLRERIRQDGLNLIGSGSTPQVKDVKYEQFWQRLNGYGVELRLYKRELGSIESMLGMRSQAAWQLPRHDPRRPQPGGSPRYRERQSIDSHRRQLERVGALAKGVGSDLADIFYRGQAPTEKDFVNAVNKLMRDANAGWSEFQTGHAVARPGEGPILEPLNPATPGVSLDFWVTVITIFIMSRNRKKD